MKIAITSARGQVGRELAFLLQQKNIPNQLLVRDPEAASFLQHASSKIVPFDFNKPETFESALKGVDGLFLICTASIKEGLIRDFLKVAKEEGIKKIIVMSGIGADKIKTHFLARLEALVEESQIPYVALRANWFIQNFGSFFKEMIVEAHELKFPDGRASISFVDARDIAEVTLYFLTNQLEGIEKGYDITGPESLSHESVAELFSKHLPYRVTYTELTEQEAKEQLGWNEEWLNLFKDIRDGLTTPVSASVEEILNKPPRSLEAYIIENKSLWIKTSSEQRT